MSWLEEWVNKHQASEKPKLDWIEAYSREDGTIVEGHFRTEANETTMDNLGTDVDQDGISGFFDADADGDGIAEALDFDGDGIADSLEWLEEIL